MHGLCRLQHCAREFLLKTQTDDGRRTDDIPGLLAAADQGDAAVAVVPRQSHERLAERGAGVCHVAYKVAAEAAGAGRPVKHAEQRRQTRRLIWPAVAVGGDELCAAARQVPRPPRPAPAGQKRQRGPALLRGSASPAREGF